jgi:hypothetical protein
MLVATPAAPTLHNYETLTFFYQVRQQFSGGVIKHKRARRHGDNQILRGAPGHVVDPTLAAVVGMEAAFVAKIRQGVMMGAHFKDHITAAPTIAAIRTAPRHILLAVEMDHAITTFAGADIYLRLIYKHKSLTLKSGARANCGRPGTVPACYFFLPNLSYRISASVGWPIS